jgi:hypothetical protein
MGGSKRAYPSSNAISSNTISSISHATASNAAYGRKYCHHNSLLGLFWRFVRLLFHSYRSRHRRPCTLPF